MIRHLLVFLFALPLSFVFLWSILSLKPSISPLKNPENKVVIGSCTWRDTNIANLTGADSLSLQLAGNLHDKNNLVLFGSSEFTDLPFAPYRFLPDSLGIPAFGFGHAHHQSYAIYCELLAMESFLDKSQVCVVLSPGWFETEGTNIEAFLEFVKPDFLKRIIHSRQISIEQKKQIGAYLHRNYHLINNPGPTIDYLVNLSLTDYVPALQKLIEQEAQDIPQIDWVLRQSKTRIKQKSRIYFDWRKTASILQKQALQRMKSNSIFVDDAYFQEHILQADGTLKKGHFDPVPLAKNQELIDLKLLIKLLQKHQCKATFVMQGLNPYHYENLTEFHPIESVIKKELDVAGFPYYSMFTDQCQQYDKGSLNDIMHMGDYGWLSVNQFLVKHYEK